MISLRLHKPTTARMIKPTRKVVTRAAVVPEMFDILHTYVCPVVKNCSGILLGSEEHQMEVLKQLHSLADHYNIVHSEPYIIKSLLNNDYDLAKDIAESTDLYHETLQIIQRLIKLTPDIYAPPEL